MTNVQDNVLDWDSEITAEETTFVLLEDGEYDFTVKDFKRAKARSGNNMAKLTLEVTDGKASTIITDHLVLTESMVWKLASFFGAIGLVKKNDTFKMNWDNVMFKTGRCVVKIEEYTKQDGSIGKINKIDKYIYKEDVKQPEPTQQSFGEERTGFTGGFSFTPPTGK